MAFMHILLDVLKLTHCPIWNTFVKAFKLPFLITIFMLAKRLNHLINQNKIILQTKFYMYFIIKNK